MHARRDGIDCRRRQTLTLPTPPSNFRQSHLPMTNLLIYNLFLTLIIFLTLLPSIQAVSIQQQQQHNGKEHLSLHQIVDSYLSNGGHEQYKKAFNLSPSVYYNPLQFFSRSEATYTIPEDIEKNQNERPVSDLELLKLMNIRVPGIDDMQDSLSRQDRTEDSDGTDTNGGCPAIGDFTTISGSKSNFQIYFNPSSTPDLVKEVMIYIGKQWADSFSSDQPIRMCFFWKELPTGTLGAATTEHFVNGSFHNELQDNVLYTPALATSLIKSTSEQNSIIKQDKQHVSMVLNQNINWHYSKNELATRDRFDLATTILHELTHGLFFTGAIRTTKKNAASFIQDIPARFDQFIQVEGNISVAKSCRNRKIHSNDLYNAIRSPKLKFFHDNRRNNASDYFVMGLHAPRVFASGSSIYHFNNETFALDCKNSNIKDCSDLMTHELTQGYTNRQLGDNTLRVYELMRSNSNGVPADAPCEVRDYPPDDSTVNTNSTGGAFTFTLSTWVIVVVAVVGGVGVVLVLAVVVSTVRRR